MMLPASNLQHHFFVKYLVHETSLHQTFLFFDTLSALRKYLVVMLVKQRRLFDRCLRERVLVLLVFCSSMKSMHLLELVASAVVEKAEAM
jgi:hypothetical protein